MRRLAATDAGRDQAAAAQLSMHLVRMRGVPAGAAALRRLDLPQLQVREGEGMRREYQRRASHEAAIKARKEIWRKSLDHSLRPDPRLSKADLQTMLAQAAQNTAAIPIAKRSEEE
jgi:hypothetical protein